MTITYKVTATVSDKGVLRSGSSVWKISIARPWVPLVSPYNSHFEWSPIQVPLSDGGKIIVLPNGLNGISYSGAVLPQKLFTDRYADDSDKVALYRSISRFVGVSRDVDCDYRKYRIMKNAESVPLSMLSCLAALIKNADGANRNYSLDASHELDGHIERISVTILNVN